jgi:hypothetical protein
VAHQFTHDGFTDACFALTNCARNHETCSHGQPGHVPIASTVFVGVGVDVVA